MAAYTVEIRVVLSRRPTQDLREVVNPARHPVDFLYSLYDALVSINVPSDKTRAVVDAMERDMGTILATKQDVENQTLAVKRDLENQTLVVKQDLEIQTLAVKQDVAILRSDMKQEVALLRGDMKQEMALLRGDMENRFALVDQRFESLRSDLSRDIVASELKLTVKLGSMMVAGFGLTIAALRLWA
ncbi:MAG: hypothetical protein ACHQX3_07745 [Nitrospirales bacterium]